MERKLIVMETGFLNTQSLLDFVRFHVNCQRQK